MKDHSAPQSGQVKKFMRFKWIGPLVVTSRPYPGVYLLKWKDSGKKWQSPMAQVQLKGYLENEEDFNSNAALATTVADTQTIAPAPETATCSKHANAPDLNPDSITTPALQDTTSQPKGQAGILKKNFQPAKDIPQPAKVTDILKKRIHRTGERQYQVRLQDGERRWINEDDTPLSLIPEFEAKWQHNRKLKDIRDAPPIPSRGTRRSSRRRRNHITQ
jgi:hypothetical protein